MERNEKNMKHKKKVKLSLIFEILAFLVLIILVVVLFFTQQNKESEKDSDVAAIQEEAEEEIVDLSSLSSTSAVLIDLDSGETLAEKNQSQIVYPASLTKMMTVLVALENIEDINTSVTLPEDIFPALREEGASMAGFANGGIATEPSIFGEAGPEMAIPLSSAKRERAKVLYEQTGKLLGITAAESEIRRSALSNVSAASIAPENLTDSNVILNMPGLDYDLLAEKLAAKMSAVLRSNPIQPIIEMKDGDVLFETERVGRKLAPVISRVQAQNT